VLALFRCEQGPNIGLDEELQYFGPKKNAKIEDNYASFVVLFVLLLFC
jgi:hypothetical protein